MAVLKDLIVHGPSRFLNAAYYNKIDADEISTNTIALQKITAKTNNTISIVAGLVDVDGELHTKSFTNSNIATIDGSFYITPTISLQGDETNGYTAVATNNSISFSGTSYNLGSAYLDGSDSPIAWSTGSTVIVTGEVLVNNEWIPLGTLKGTLSTYSTNTNPNVVGITNILDSVNQSSKILGLIAGTGNLPYRKVKISLISVNRSGLKPLGIYMTAAGSNGRTFLDIYGGNLVESTTYGGLSTPVVRIGNLSGSNLPPVGNVTPNGWGIYTSNGFFSGTMVAKRGIIGEGTKAWTIGKTSNTGAESFLYAPTTGPQSPSANTVGIYIGTDGINNYASSTQYVRIYGGKIYAQGVDITGKITASSGLIGGWNIGTDANKSLYYGGTTPSATNLVLSKGTVASSTSVGGSTGSLSWMILAGNKFGVTTGGALYASEANISGAINATSLNVGSASSSNHLIYNSTTNTIDLSTDWLKFDSTAKAVIIGNNNNAMSANISGSDFILKDKDSNPFFYAGDLRGGENAKITESIVAGTRFNYIRLDVSYKIETSDEVTVTDSNGNTIQCTIGSNGYYLTSDDLIDGDTYTVVYYTAEPLYAITFTQRDPNYGTVIGANSVNFAYNGRCSGSGAFCEGYATTASGKFSHAEGRSSRASGDYSHAEGESFAESRDAHAEGGDCYARGGWSHAEGYKCESNATYSHAGGFYSKAEGYKSYASGDNVVAQGCSQFVIGKYNDPQGSETTIDNSDYAFIIGNGTSSVLSNALTVDWKGVTSYYGDVTNASLQVPPNSSTISSVTYAANSGGKITEISFTKKGNLAMIRFQVTSTSAISSGSNILTAQLVSKYHPIQYTTGVGYYGGHAIIGRINTSGQLIIRNASSSGVTLSSSIGGVEVAFTYILKDYFV